MTGEGGKGEIRSLKRCPYGNQGRPVTSEVAQDLQKCASDKKNHSYVYMMEFYSATGRMKCCHLQVVGWNCRTSS
jgi:hypothetical protein